MALVVTDRQATAHRRCRCSFPPGLLPLDEALARARSLTDWSTNPGSTGLRSIDIRRRGAFRPCGDGSEGRSAASWEEAARILADEARR